MSLWEWFMRWKNWRQSSAKRENRKIAWNLRNLSSDMGDGKKPKIWFIWILSWRMKNYYLVKLLGGAPKFFKNSPGYSNTEDQQISVGATTKKWKRWLAQVRPRLSYLIYAPNIEGRLCWFRWETSNKFPNVRVRGLAPQQTLNKTLNKWLATLSLIETLREVWWWIFRLKNNSLMSGDSRIISIKKLSLLPIIYFPSRFFFSSCIMF